MMNIFVFLFATFSTQNETGLDAGLDFCGQYRFQPIKSMNSVVPSPCETEPYNNESYKYLRLVIFPGNHIYNLNSVKFKHLQNLSILLF